MNNMAKRESVDS